MARLVHLLQPDDSEKSLDVLYKLYVGTRKMFGKGGKERIKYAPTSIFRTRITTCDPDRVEAGPYSVPG